MELDPFGRGTPHSRSLSPNLYVQNLISDDLQVWGLQLVPAWLSVAWDSKHLRINTYPVHVLTSPALIPALLPILLHHIQALVLRVFFSLFEILYYIYLCGGRVGSQVPGLERKCQKASVGVGFPPFTTRLLGIELWLSDSESNLLSNLDGVALLPSFLFHSL